MQDTGISHSRRSLVKAAATGLAGVLMSRRVLGANSDVRIAVIGLGNKGAQHVRVFREMPGVRVVALCDVDPKRLAEQVTQLDEVFSHTDPRRILDRDDVDAVVIATPDQWHVLLAVWACQAGKDVYVEKPVSHNVWEGRKLIEAAAKYQRVVQAGLQYRSDEGLKEAAEYLRQGTLGKMLWGHVPWYERRGSIGKVAAHTPDWLDYDLYCGPAPVLPLRREKLHYDWHWVWSTGTGDLGNSGIHAFDVCRWFAGYEGLPPRVMCVGGRFGVNDAGETPNTQLTVLDYDPAPIFIEDRNLPTKTGAKWMDHVRDIREGVIFQCEHGYFAGFRGGGWAYDNQGKRLKQFTGDGGSKHTANFIQAVRDRKPELLNAPIQVGHVSSAACHLGNLSYRLGRPATEPGILQAVGDFEQAGEAVRSLDKHLLANDVDPDREPWLLGPWMTVDSETEEITKVDEATSPESLDPANRLVRGSYRSPFVVPDSV
jgi:predicted dehydrogenase